MSKLLVADDEDSIRMLVAEVAEPLGYTVERAANGAEAIKQLETQAFDVLITDINMGYGKTGFDVVTYASGLTPKPYIIMASGTWSGEQRIKAAGLNVDEQLDKPFAIHELGKKLEELAKGCGSKPQEEKMTAPEYK